MAGLAEGSGHEPRSGFAYQERMTRCPKRRLLLREEEEKMIVPQVWYEAMLRVRRPGSPACPGHRVELEASVSVQIPVTGDRLAAARTAAEEAFRELGLGAVMDLEGARTGIEVWLS